MARNDRSPGGQDLAPGQLPPSIDGVLADASDALATEVLHQWNLAAERRGLAPHGPIPVRWARSKRPVVGPVGSVLNDARNADVPPVPGIEAPTRESLDGGDADDLFRVYCGLPSGRLMILGEGGAGKTGMAISLVRKVLEYRKQLDDRKRAGVAVPVILTPGDWDPAERRLEDWLAERLEADYPVLRSRTYGPGIARRLVRAGLVALVLDGLDDMPRRVRPTALRALDEQARFRIVVLGGPKVTEDASVGAHLSAAVAVELLPVAPHEAADYLIQRTVDPPPADWERLVKDIRTDPGCPAAQALSTPLMLTLVRDTYRERDRHVDELLDRDTFPTRQTVEDHLLHRAVPAAYSRRPAEKKPPYSREWAQRWLSYLAGRMNSRNTRDLAWWCVQHCVSKWQRMLLVGVVSGLLSGLLFAVWGCLTDHALLGFLAGFPLGPLAAAFNDRVVSPDEHRDRRVVGRLIATGAGLASLASGLLTGVLLGGDRDAALGGGVTGLIVGMVLGVPAMIGGVHLLEFNLRPAAAPGAPRTPHASWKRDRLHSLGLGLILGLLMDAAAVAVCLVVHEPLVRVGWVIALQTLVMPLFAYMFSASAKTTLAVFRLWVQGRCPLRLVHFLEDARERGLLRTAGPVYQFRHARLQDVLARGHAGSAPSPQPPDRPTGP